MNTSCKLTEIMMLKEGFHTKALRSCAQFSLRPEDKSGSNLQTQCDSAS